MDYKAKDIMFREYHTIRPEAPILEAVNLIFHGNIRKNGYKTISLMVTNEFNQLVGVISMFDILYYFRPEFLNYGLDSIENWKGSLKPLLSNFSEMTVEHAMSSPVLTVSSEDHIMVLLDKMIKKKARRLPVIEDNKLVGVVYQSDIYDKIFGEYR
ncbi:CBS domain-containing protein [bacterium]|nr:CBS domain-containing protein [bacterium]